MVGKTEICRGAMAAILFAFVLIQEYPAAGFVHSDNFVVVTPSEGSDADDERFARKILAKAEEYREKIAHEWLSAPLPPSVGRTVINVNLQPDEDQAITWAKDHPSRTHHAVYLTTSRENALGSTLMHEVAHVVLATEFSFPQRLPAWLEEGIASRYDNPSRLLMRQQILNWYARRENWPLLKSVLTAENISNDDKSTYAIASSLVEYLLSLEDRETLFRFGQVGSAIGWEQAVQKCYSLRNVNHLERQWQAWVKRGNRIAMAKTHRRTSQ